MARQELTFVGPFERNLIPRLLASVKTNSLKCIFVYENATSTGTQKEEN